MIRFFIGKVNSVDETFHTIEFSMEDFTNSSALYLPAIPLVPTTVLPEQDDEVLVIQPDSNVEIFYYSQMPNPSEDKTYVQLKYGTAYVRISKENDKYTITAETSNDSSIVLGNGSATVQTKNASVSLSDTGTNKISLNGGGTITMNDSQVLINGHLKVT